MPPKAAAGKVGRPRLPDSVGTKEKVEARLYMRQYNAKILKDINELSKMELECTEELEQIKKEKKALEKEYKQSIKMLEDANKQAENILNEAAKK